MNARPPGRVSLLWCPACGRDDRYTFLRNARPHKRPDGKQCSGKPQELEYVIPRAPEPLPGAQDGSYRAAVAVEVVIRPAPPHLADGDGRVAFVGQTMMLHANTVEELALLVEASADLITSQLGDQVAVHPRPAPPMGWPT